MMKYFISCISILFFLDGVIAQSNSGLFEISSKEDRIQFQVIEKEDHLELKIIEQASSNKFPEITSLALKDGGLVLDYEYNGQSQYHADRVVQLIALISPNGNTTLISDHQINRYPLKEKRKIQGQRIWQDAMESHIFHGEEYTLVIKRTILDNVNCEAERPSFSTHQAWQNYAITSVAIAASVSIGLGQIYKNKKDNAYRNYQNGWLEGKNSSEVQDDLASAEDYEDKAKNTTYIGWALLVGDAIWLGLRWRKINKRQKKYDTYCQPKSDSSIKFFPDLQQPNEHVAPFGYVPGAKLVYNF